LKAADDALLVNSSISIPLSLSAFFLHLHTSAPTSCAVQDPAIRHLLSPAMATSDQTVNIPQLLIVLLLGGLAIRYFFFSNSAAQGTGRNGGRGVSNGLRAREADVERIQQMFPQVARRTIMWDLQRNGGNVVATTERVLSGRGLEEVSMPRWFMQLLRI